MKVVLKIIEYLKKNLRRGIIIDYREPSGIPKCKMIQLDFGYQYSKFEKKN